MLPAGKYYIGDPCYVIRDHNWSDFCEAFFKAEQEDQDVFEYDGQTVFASHTFYGDGRFDDQDGYTYGVDAGMIGAIPLALIPGGEAQAAANGRVVDFKQPFDAWYEKDGTFWIGNVRIFTGFDDPEEDDEEEDDYDLDDYEDDVAAGMYDEDEDFDEGDRYGH